MCYRLSSAPLFTETVIQNRVCELACEIESSFEYDMIIGVLTGAFIFISDLSRKLQKQTPLHFIQTKSYGKSVVSGGKVEIVKLDNFSLEGKRVLLIDDILDTGKTLAALSKDFQAQGVSEIKTCVLLDKPSRRETKIQADFRGFEIEDFFVVGYGMDYADRYRTLPCIFTIVSE